MFFIIIFLILSAILIIYVNYNIPILNKFAYFMLSMAFVFVLMITMFMPSNTFYEPIKESIVELRPLSGRNFFSKGKDIYLYKNTSNEYFYSLSNLSRSLNVNEIIYQKDNNFIIRLSNINYRSRIRREKDNKMIVKVIEEDTNKPTLEIYIAKGKPNFFTFAINCYCYTYIFRLPKNSAVSEI